MPPRGLVPNKSTEIRKAARELVTQGKPPRPKTIRELLSRKGIEVTSQQVSMALSKTEFAYRRNHPEHTMARVSIDDVILAKDLAQRLGGIEKARAALTALEHFRPEPTTQPTTGV